MVVAGAAATRTETTVARWRLMRRSSGRRSCTKQVPVFVVILAGILAEGPKQCTLRENHDKKSDGCCRANSDHLTF